MGKCRGVLRVAVLSGHVGRLLGLLRKSVRGTNMETGGRGDVTSVLIQ